MTKRIGGRTQLELEIMEARLVLTAATAVGLTAPPQAIVDVAVQAAPETPADSNDTFARGVERADFNADGVIDATDIDLLSAAINLGKFNALFDLDGDNELAKEDMDSMIYEWLETNYGDADLDGFVDSNDFTLWVNNAFQSGGWAQGDFNGDLYVDGYDFLAWNSAKKEFPAVAASRANDNVKSISEEGEEELVSDTDVAVEAAVQEPLQQPLSSGVTHATTATHDLDEVSEKKSRDDQFLKLG